LNDRRLAKNGCAPLPRLICYMIQRPIGRPARSWSRLTSVGRFQPQAADTAGGVSAGLPRGGLKDISAHPGENGRTRIESRKMPRIERRACK